MWLPWVPWMGVYESGLWACAVFQVGFVLVFVTTSWRRYRTGRALFVKSAVIAVLLALTLAGLYLVIPHTLEIAAVLMWVLAAAIAYLLWSVVRQKFLDRRQP